MRQVLAANVLLFSTLLMSSMSYSQDGISIPDGPYLGQKAPGSTPEIFAPGIVNKETSVDLEGMFGSDMNTFYFTREGKEYSGIAKVGPSKGESVSYGLAVYQYKKTNGNIP